MDEALVNGDLDDAERMTRYLLGELSPEDAEALEKEYFVREDLFESLLAAEEALIDAYAASRLPDERRRRFEERFLAKPDGRERVRFARDLIERASLPSRADAAAPTERWGSAARALLAAGLAALIVSSAWSYLHIRDLGRRLRDAQATRESLEREQDDLRRELEAQRRRIAQLTDEVAGGQSSSRALRVALWILRPGMTREAGPQARLEIPAGTDQVQLRLLLEEDTHRTYAAVLASAEGRELWRQDGLRSHAAQKARAVDLALSPRLLERGTYVVILSGSVDGGRYEQVEAYHLFVTGTR